MKRESKRTQVLESSNRLTRSRGTKQTFGANTERSSAADRPKRSLTKNAKRRGTR